MKNPSYINKEEKQQ